MYKVLGRFIDLIIYINIYNAKTTFTDYRIHFHALLVRTDIFLAVLVFIFFLSKKYRPWVGVISESESMVWIIQFRRVLRRPAFVVRLAAAVAWRWHVVVVVAIRYFGMIHY